MQTLHFKLISNNNEIINDKTTYYIKDNIIHFYIDECFYKYDLTNHIFSKKDNEKELVINFNKKVILIECLKENMKFDYPIDKITKKNSKNNVQLEYTLDGEEKLVNTIIIEF